MDNLFSESKQWEQDCIKTRRWLWLRKRRLQKFGFHESDKILDLGCGDGLNSKILREEGIRDITGIDISESLLSQAKKLNPDILFVLGSVEKLPFLDKSFDIVFVDSAFHHFTHVPKSLQQIYRVLKKGGHLCFSESHKSLFRQLFDAITLFPFSSNLPFFKERRPAYLAEKDFITYWLAHEKEFIAELKEVGFKKIFLNYDLLSVIGKYEKV